MEPILDQFAFAAAIAVGLASPALIENTFALAKVIWGYRMRPTPMPPETSAPSATATGRFKPAARL